MSQPVVPLPELVERLYAAARPLALTPVQAEHAGRVVGHGTVRDAVSGCLVWTGRVNSRGVPNHTLAGTRRRVLLRRVAWALAHGSTPAGLMVALTCGEPRCLEPEHMWLATPAARWRATIAAGRHPNVHERGCARGHAMTAENVAMVLEKGRRYRRCRRCDVLRHQAMDARRRSAGLPVRRRAAAVALSGGDQT